MLLVGKLANLKNYWVASFKSHVGKIGLQRITHRVVLCMSFLVSFFVCEAAETEGWNNINPGRKEFPVQKLLWEGDFSAAKLELRDGAKGSMQVVEQEGKKALRIVKSNDKGMMIVTAQRFAVQKGTKLRAFAYCQCEDGDPESGDAYLRLYGRKEDLSYFKDLDGRGPGGPRMQKMVNSPPGGRIRKLAHRLADKATGTSITAAIVVSGPPCTSVWTDWGVEDKTASDKAWIKYRKSLEPGDTTYEMMDAAAFNAKLAAERDHTARIAKVGDYARLFVDGKMAPPVIFRGQTAKNGKITYAGGIHDRNGVRLQSMTVNFCRCEKVPHGIWTKDAFDAKMGADIVRTTMRLAPESVFILTLRLDAYPEWADMHPGEEWRLADGRKVHGSSVHADFHVQATLPKGKWHWPSYHSLVWREDVKSRISALVDELKRQGLSRKIVGVHIAGYHDAQFATRHPDFSKSAVAAFVEWQKKRYGKVRWTEAPVFGKKPVFDRETDGHHIEYLKFVKQGPFHMQEDLARHIRKCFGKDIIIGRYCMGWNSAAFNTALDLDPFVSGRDIDYLVAQPSYAYRTPGVAIGSRIPTRTFHENGKLYVNEFDLRTYGGVHGGEVELRVLGLSQATDYPMWLSVHHKLAGQMLSQRMGWWYLDMSGKWFSPPEIAKDIADVHSRVLDVEAAGTDGWRPTVAIAIDEQGMLMRNSIGNYYSSADKEMQEQIRSFAASGVPVETVMADDLARNPALGERYKIVFFSNLDRTDPLRRKMIAHLEGKAVKCVFLSSEKPLTPAQFALADKAAGAYVPAEYGLQVDMNGNFISLHALRNGRYEFKLPRKCKVVNMKTGKTVKSGTALELNMTAGETRWYRLLD